MPKGVVKWFNDKKGYGFIVSEIVEDDIFVHYTALNQSGFRTLLQGQQVEFELNQDVKGARASNVSIVAE